MATGGVSGVFILLSGTDALKLKADDTVVAVDFEAVAIPVLARLRRLFLPRILGIANYSLMEE